MNVLVWATSFGADLWSLTRYLGGRPEVNVRVVLSEPEAFEREPVNRLFPLRAEIIRRRTRHHLLGLPAFEADVTIMDNRVPLRANSSAGFVLWHGFGWKGPNDEKEFAWLHNSIARNWGSAKEPNPRFRWQAFGPTDAKHRSEVSRVHIDNIRILGAASHDELRHPLDKARLREAYPFDVTSRPTVLIAPTWHYDEVFSHWGSDHELFERLLSLLVRRGANVIVRLHDSFRFSPGYVRFVRQLADRFEHVLVKFKDECPDNYLDLQVADVLITNFSSIANLYYATGRPTVHIYPVRDADEQFMWRQQTLFGQVKRKVESAHFVWKLPPEEHGGLLARDFDALLEQVDRSLDDPDCCRDAARRFLEMHMLGADGKSCERTFDALRELVDAARACC
jgi:hypothetical protein